MNSDLENYLKENTPQYLWKYYFQHKDYTLSATQLLIHIKTFKELTLPKRIKLLKKDLALARGTGLTSLYTEAQILLKTSESQIDYLMREGKDVDTEMMIESPQNLFNNCCKSNYWDLVLYILSFYPIAEVDKHNLVSSVWMNIIITQFSNLNLEAIQQIIVNIANKIGIDNQVMDLKILMPLLENQQRVILENQNLHRTSWALETFLMCKYNICDLFNIYYDAIKNNELEKNIKADFVYCLSLIIEKNGNIQNKPIDDIVKWFYENATNMEYFDKVCNIIDP